MAGTGDVNFENILGEMIALAHWVTPAPLGNPLTRAVRDGKLSPPLSDAPYNIVQEAACLLRRLAEHMRERSRALNKNALEFQKYRCVLSRLRDEFEVGESKLR